MPIQVITGRLGDGIHRLAVRGGRILTTQRVAARSWRQGIDLDDGDLLLPEVGRQIHPGEMRAFVSWLHAQAEGRLLVCLTLRPDVLDRVHPNSVWCCHEGWAFCWADVPDVIAHGLGARWASRPDSEWLALVPEEKRVRLLAPK